MRNVFIAAALAVGLTGAMGIKPSRADAAAPWSAPLTLHVTQTYLRAEPGRRADLIKYIQRNWFVMDQIGLEQGLFTSFALLERQEGAVADWDVIVTVGYPTADGHEAPGVADAFRAIRSAHKEVKIDGRGLKELGAIVRHYGLRVVRDAG